MNSQEALQQLLTLGDTADEIAASLETLGIKGNPGWPGSCPITNYLISCGAYDCCVGAVSFRIGKEVQFLPEPISQFIDDFDDGKKYQQLRGQYV
jgi:hypothetical protein